MRMQKCMCVFVFTCMYWVAHEKRPKLCNDAVLGLLNNRIQTKGNNIFKEQSQLNNMTNYDVIRFCFDSEIPRRVLGVRRVHNNQ